jgi:hypothetical protein
MPIPLFIIACIAVIVREFLREMSRYKHVPKTESKEPKQTTLIPFMHDHYPYGRQWVLPEEDSEYSELAGYESSAEMDLEDTDDN